MVTGEAITSLPPWVEGVASATHFLIFTTSNARKSHKRNILGDVLHFLAGVPTDEMMAKQVM
jgi:ABC-type phosphate transport system permease subunit